ncbi:hypothetical protein [Pseudomonas putida]|uniref:Uncharacterized protein n=1 Tax=Pseudomonas putida TaxID=303 RepID=A0A1X0ZKN4_PSEPU|nr:hypothetical protein [Pseudomonas putida]KAF0253582.1 hypothetical protein GN299_17390 [Pseudomonas putida]MCE0882680.1 hypothetical protein [Pseudomonas putida]MDD1985540.1 hypothetical protein [Pseudomonas putida]MDF3873691.1 hypothetical protein [Pseudomonas putida]MDF3876222.1 hypothetical protein [Pseudomonas putida]
MKIRACCVALMIGLAFQAGAHAKETLLTAHVAADGTLLQQSPQWISSVELQAQPNYFNQYKILLKPSATPGNPRFCVASPIDASSYDRQLHGQAKVIGTPRASHVTVMTQLLDMPGASGDNALEFMLMCSR